MTFTFWVFVLIGISLSLIRKKPKTILLSSLLVFLPVLFHSLIMWFAPISVKYWLINEKSWGVLITTFVYFFCLPLCLILFIAGIIKMVLKKRKNG